MPFWRELVIGLLPAAAGLLIVLVLAGARVGDGPAAPATAALGAMAVAAAIAVLRLRRSQRLEDWLAGLVQNDSTRHPTGLDEPIATTSCAP